ncbi:MAG: hypothetical protein ACM30G_01555 [Micromonosporaceae bacterium]
MNLDDEVRGTLVVHANDAPDGVGLLDAVMRRSRRRELRHRTGLGGIAVVTAVAVVIATPYVFARTRPGTIVGNPSATDPSPSASALPTSVPSWPSTVQLVPAVLPPVMFPLTPQWVPPGIGEATVGRNDYDLRLVYLWGSSSLITTVGPELVPPDWRPTTTESTTIGSRPATLTTGTTIDGEPSVRITWQLSDRRWVDLQSAGPLSKADVQRFADNLRPQPLTRPLPFTLALVPAGYQVIFQELHPELTPYEFYFAMAPAASLDDPATWINVRRTAEDAKPAGGQPVQVGPDPGEITTSGPRISLTVHRPGFDFVVGEADHGPLSIDDLIRFAIGVSQS